MVFAFSSRAMGKRAMKSIAILTSAAVAFGTAMVGGANSQSQPGQQGATSPGGMMSNGFMGGMMGYDGGPGTMRWGASGSAMESAMGSAMGATMCGAMAGHIEGRLAYVKAELKITDAQESLWNSYAVAARDSANTMLARCASMMSRHSGSTISLPDRLDQNEQLMAAQLDAMRTMNKALKPLYAVLTETQKQSADQLFWGPMGMM
jgi:LTXXQ motif family protein